MLNKIQANYLWYTSWCSLLSSIYGLRRGHVIAVLPGCIFVTSINYWRNPVTNSYRRYTDIATVVVCLTCQNIYVIEAQYARLYYIMIGYGILWYPIAKYFSYRKQYWRSVIAHSMIHIVCNIANVLLYSGRMSV
jgi:hypothetical protein